MKLATPNTISGAIKNHCMSYGSFATYVHPNQRYGIIFGASPKGMQMDIDQLMYTAVSKNNNRDELTAFVRSQGPRQSDNEHLIPEQLFDDSDTLEKEVEGVSAVKAIQIAAGKGQTIYTLNKENYAQILPKLQLSSTTMTDIQNAVNAGREVTTHEKTLSYKGWSGAGYIIVDPSNGAGAYLIEGGANGGQIISSDNLLIASTALLSISDIETRDNNGKPMFKDYASSKYHLNKMTKVAGYIGLAASLVLTWQNDTLSTVDKIFQTLTAIAGVMLINATTTALLASATGPVGIALLATVAIMFAIIVSMAIILINTEYTGRFD